MAVTAGKKYNIVKEMPKEIFRSYDIRGIVDETLSEDIVYTIGLAIGAEIISRGGKDINVGRDGRLSGPSYLKALSTGLCAAGLNVVDIGRVPTPLLYYATCVLKSNSGAMLTGSHNPTNHNGIKIVALGKTLFGDDIQKLYQRIIKAEFVIAKEPGKETTERVIASYIKRITSDIKLERKLKIVIDCGNGAGGDVAPELFKSLGCDVTTIFGEVDGTFPNHHPDPSIVANLNDLIAAVKKEQADIGIAFDGDADRLGVVTNAGEVILPDRLVMLFAIDLLKRHPGEPIPFDVKCTRHLGEQIAKHGGKPHMVATGHSILKAKMNELHALLAGELSGHIFMKERWYGFDDGMYVAARLLELVAAASGTSSALFATLPNSINTPELKIAMPDERKKAFMQKIIASAADLKDATIITTDGLRVEFKDGFGLVRQSNTTPHLTVRFEGDNDAALERIKKIFKEKLLALDSGLQLPF